MLVSSPLDKKVLDGRTNLFCALTAFWKSCNHVDIVALNPSWNGSRLSQTAVQSMNSEGEVLPSGDKDGERSVKALEDPLTSVLRAHETVLASWCKSRNRALLVTRG